MIILFALLSIFSFFFFNDTATTEIYTLSLHDALPIYWVSLDVSDLTAVRRAAQTFLESGQPIDVLVNNAGIAGTRDRKSTRLNSSHSQISYAVFCLKKKK